MKFTGSGELAHIRSRAKKKLEGCHVAPAGQARSIKLSEREMSAMGRKRTLGVGAICDVDALIGDGVLNGCDARQGDACVWM